MTQVLANPAGALSRETEAKPAPIQTVRGKRLPHFVRWLRSLPDFLNLLHADEPWVTFGAIDWLERTIKPHMRVAEFGSGASTLYWAKRVKEIVAVEHHEGWHGSLTKILEEKGIDNCTYILAQPKTLNGSLASAPKHAAPQSYRSLKKGYEEQSFEAYAKAIEAEPDGSFDIVFVDGRARVACARETLRKVKPGGYLVLDNAERERYDTLRDEFAGLARTDFTSMGPRQIGSWTTTVWQVPQQSYSA